MFGLAMDWWPRVFSLILMSGTLPASASTPPWSSPVHLSGVPTFSFVSLDVVSCARAGDCVALGSRPGPSAYTETTYVVTETNGKWSRARTLGGASFTPAMLRCTAVGTCIATGQSTAYDANGNLTPAVVTEVHGVWSPITLLTDLLPASTITTITAIECLSPGNCALGGVDANSNPVLLSESAGVWYPTATFTTLMGPDQPQTGLGAPALIACPSPGNCVATGPYSPRKTP